jgi:hypothetical protein
MRLLDDMYIELIYMKMLYRRIIYLYGNVYVTVM